MLKSHVKQRTIEFSQFGLRQVHVAPAILVLDPGVRAAGLLLADRAEPYGEDRVRQGLRHDPHATRSIVFALPRSQTRQSRCRKQLGPTRHNTAGPSAACGGAAAPVHAMRFKHGKLARGRTASHAPVDPASHASRSPFASPPPASSPPARGCGS